LWILTYIFTISSHHISKIKLKADKVVSNQKHSALPNTSFIEGILKAAALLLRPIVSKIANPVALATASATACLLTVQEADSFSS
jgi:hypothetical protein